MKVAGLRGVSRRRGFIGTTERERGQRPAPDLVKRECIAQRANQHLWSPRIVGWSFGETMHAERVLAALNMALTLRKPEGVIHHSD